jgi:ATP-binding cassette subfamily B protein
MKEWRFLKISRASASLKPLKKYVAKYRKILAVGFLFMIFSNLIQICEPIIINNGFKILNKNYSQPHMLVKVFEYFHIGTKYEILIFFSLLFFSVNLIRLPFIYFHELLIMSAAKRIEGDLRSGLFCHLQRLSLSYYHKQKTGDIMTRLTDDVRCVDEFAEASISLGNYLVLAPISAIYLFLIGKTLMFYVLIPLIGISIVVYIFSKHIHKYTRIARDHFGLLSSKVQESLSGVRIIKSYANEDTKLNDYQKINRENVRKSMVPHRIYSSGRGLLVFLIGLSQLIFLLFGCSFIISGKITPENFVAFFYQLNHLIWPVIILGVSINLFQGALARMERISEILQQKPDIEDSEETNQSLTSITGEIELKNLTFSFAEDKVILRNINIKLEKGKSIGIIGNIGSGKSTLVNLIARLYNGPKKTIFIDNHPIENIPLRTLRANIGYVPQESFLFSGSIRENICFGLHEVSQEILNRASMIADIKKDIDEFPQRYETFVGEKGVTLSGGQKQRIGIARSIIIQPKILLLDNSLSQVDSDTEKKILKNLAGEMKNSTVIFVSNRMASIKDAELIVVLINGQIVESGTHKELLQTQGFYFAFFKREAMEEVLETL